MSKRFLPKMQSIVSVVVALISRTSSHSRAHFLPGTFAILFASTTILPAQPFSFQGRITDASGVPLNGNYDLEFRLYDQEAGGSQLGPVVQYDSELIQEGLLNVRLDFSVSFTGFSYWLEISVRQTGSTGPLESLDRVFIAYAPRALNALRVEDLLAKTGNDVEYRSPYDMRFYLDADNNQSNEWFSVHNSSGAFLLLLREDGSLTATAGTGDASIVLPVGSISAIETNSEAGVVENFGGDHYLDDGAVTSLASTTISAPVSGYVIVVAGATQITNLDNAPAFRSSFDISTDISMGSDSVLVALPTGVTVPLTLHKVFPVTAGVSTFHFVGRGIEILGLENARITALFVPTTYGIVASGPSTIDGTRQVADPSPLSPEQERAAAIEANQARIRRELEAIEAQVKALQEETRP
jgi:hypothetical protein